MSFPLSPSNNQIALVNGIEYYWYASKGAWYRYGDGSANVITSNTFQVLSSIIFSDGTSQTSAASPTDSYARTTANTATNNITILQGVDLTQNTNITNATNAATAAFAQANATAGGLTTANINITIIQGVDTAQNTRMSIIEGVDVTQNTNITIATNASTAAFEQANATAGGLTTANSRITIAEGVDLAQNTRMDIIEGVNTTQNTNITILQGVNTTQNTNITNADTKAQAAFDKANDAYTLANTANSAAAASGGSSETFTTYIDRFTGNGSQTQFTLSVTPDTENQTMVFLNGVYQNKDTYSVSGANVIFTDTATANDTIEVSTFTRVTNVNSSMYKTKIYQGDGTTNTFTISSGHTANTILVFNNGVAQFPIDDYTVSGTTVTYVLTPESDETIQIRELPVNTLVPATQALMRRYTANGVQTQFTVTSGQTANSLLVFENGICQVPINDYTVSGTILTFVTAPIANVVVQIRELSI
jgi:hypothetical protein